MKVIIKVLCVDDDRSFLTLGLEYIKRVGGIETIPVNSAVDALAALKREDPDVVVSDYQMPGMDGIDLLKEIRRRGKDIPFILFTGKGREEVAIEALNSGANFYLQKGGDPRSQFMELANTIRQLAEKREAEKALRESEKRYRILSEKVQDCMRYINLDMEIEYVSPSIEYVLGYTDDDRGGWHFQARQLRVREHDRILNGGSAGKEERRDHSAR